MSKQYGFYFDESRCVQCRTCELSCKAANNVEFGVSLRTVPETWSGTYPDIQRTFFSKACMHCEQPPCVPACAAGAITKREEDGIVIVDREKCTGCRDCLEACPYDIPQFGKDGTMQKCDYCMSSDYEPACTQSCPAEAIFSGSMEELLKMAEGRNVRRLEGDAGPSIIIVS